MTKIELMPENKASEETKELYGILKSKIGKVPNIYQVYGHSSAALKANLMMDDALAHGELSPKAVEIVALTVSQFNNCEYCIAAHTTVGKMCGMTEREIIDVRKGTYTVSKEKALIDFTKVILTNKGKISEENLNAFLQVGYTNGAVVEVVGQIAKNFFNNYTNHIAGTSIDFPKPVTI